MKRSWLQGNKIVAALTLLVLIPLSLFAQGQGTAIKKPAHHHSVKRVKSKPHSREITHGSDDDKKLREIKAQKEKEKAGK